MPDEVDRRYAGVLRPQEHDLSRAFRGLAIPAQRLYVRLISRKGPLFRSDRLVYLEIGDPALAAAEARRSGLMSIDEPEDRAAAVASAPAGRA
jgi:hypothetical protein